MLRLATRLQAVLDHRRWLAPAVLLVVSSLVLLVRIGEPPRIMFDEVYYVNDARSYLELGVEDGFAVHPTVGKWLIAASITLLGDTPTGWRFLGGVAGVLTVLATYGIARRLLRGTPGASVLALVAPLLLVMDGLFLAQSRIAMLDVFLLLFSTIGLWLLVVDHDQRVLAAGEPRRWVPSMRVLAGVSFGLAVGTKWSGLLAVGVAGLLTIAWEIAAARDADMRGWVGQLPRRAAAVAASLLLVPALVYGATWVPWLASYENTYTAGCREEGDPPVPVGQVGLSGTRQHECDFALGERVAGLGRYHLSIARFHLGLEATHAYRSDPVGWVVLERPVVYWWETCSEDRANGVPSEDEDTGELVVPEPCLVAQGDAGEVLAVGNPALWWGFLLLLPALVAGAVRRDGRSAVPLVAWLGFWLPWLAVSRTAFLFYLVPAIPFLAVGATVAVARIGERARLRRPYGGAAFGAVLGLALVSALQATGAGEGWRWRLVGAGAGWLLGSLVGGLLDLREPRGIDPELDITAILAAEPPLGSAVTVVDAEGEALEPGDAQGEALPPGDIGSLADGTYAGGPVIGAAVADTRQVTTPLTLAEVGDDDLAHAEAMDSRTALLLFVLVGLVLAAFIWFAPVWLAVPMSRAAVGWRWWLQGWI